MRGLAYVNDFGSSNKTHLISICN